MTVDPGVLAAADRNMIQAWAGIANAVSGPAGVVQRDEVLLLSMGEPVALFNPAFVLQTPKDPGRLVDDVAAHYAKLGVPFALYFRDEPAPGLGEACAYRGLIEHWQLPLMVLDPIPAQAPAPPAGLEIAGIGKDDVETYVRVLAGGFGIPMGMAQRIFGVWLLSMEGFIPLLGLMDGTPVATSAVFTAEKLAGVYNVSTLSEYRGKGIGAAMTWAAAIAGQQQGLNISVLQASSAGEPVYRGMGYTTPDHYRQFELA